MFLTSDNGNFREFWGLAGGILNFQNGEFPVALFDSYFWKKTF